MTTTTEHSDKIIAEDIASLLTERLGETGDAYLRGADLYYRAESNSGERYLGEVEDVESVKAALAEYFGPGT